jgi:hypothetical protein
MGAGTKAAICVAAALFGVVAASWVVSLVESTQESECKTTSEGVTCIVHGTTTPLLFALPVAIASAGLALILVRAYERRSDRNAES